MSNLTVSELPPLWRELTRDDVLERVLLNLTRVSDILTSYERAVAVGSTGVRSATHTSDILRQGVVLLHATLEDGLRAFLRLLLPRSKAPFDPEILLGVRKVKRIEREILLRSKHKTAAQVWELSLEAYLGSCSFGSSKKIVYAAKKIGIDVSQIRPFLVRLSKLASRRHHIAHNADINEMSGAGGQTRLRSIHFDEVCEWHTAVFVFFASMFEIKVLPEELLQPAAKEQL